MDCNKSKMKKKKNYMKENEEFMALKDFYKEILSETRAIRARTELRDFNPKDVAGNKRNPIDNPFKQTGESRGRRGFVQGKPARRFVNPVDTARPRGGKT